MTKVQEGVFLGSLDDADQLASSNPHRIKTVIVLCTDKPQTSCATASYIHIPVSDERPIPRPTFNSVMSAIAEGVQGGKVLVCCGAGMSRSPALLAAYLHRVGLLDFAHALEHLKKLRPVVNPSKTLIKSIQEHLNG